jgi:hypothetical protein
MTEIEFLLRELLRTQKVRAAAAKDYRVWPDLSVPQNAWDIFCEADDAFSDALHAIFVYARNHYGND